MHQVKNTTITQQVSVKLNLTQTNGTAGYMIAARQHCPTVG